MLRSVPPSSRVSRHPVVCGGMALMAAMFAAGCGDDAIQDVAPAECGAPPERAAFVVLPDTQFYACAYPDIFVEQTQWIADNVDAAGVGLVLHTGDIVDRDSVQEWQVAADALHLLDANTPYLLVPGNHDIDAARRGMLDDWFSPLDLSMGGCTAMSLKDTGRIGNAYALVELRGSPWLFVGIEFAPRDETLEWAAGVLSMHAAVPAVIFTHAYLYASDERYDRAIQPLQPFHPDTYQPTAAEGIADGQDIWETLVEPHENVQLVLSGHVIPDGTARSRARRASGTVVHEILTNFQFCGFCPCEEVMGGGGYLRIFELDEQGTSLHVSTYSPHLDRFLRDDENEFDLPLDR